MAILFRRAVEIPIGAVTLLVIALSLPRAEVWSTMALVAAGLLLSLIPTVVRRLDPSRVLIPAWPATALAPQHIRFVPALSGNVGPIVTTVRTPPLDGTAYRNPMVDDTWQAAADARVGTPRAFRKDTHVTKEGSPERPGIDAQRPDSMPRAEDDTTTWARSPEFHDRPGSGKRTANRQEVF